MSGRETTRTNEWIPQMQRDWNQRAASNARYFICTDVSEEEFLASGRRDYDRHVRTFLTEAGWNPGNKVALEIGCGTGRMTRWFAEEFSEVIGLDVSSEMIERAKASLTPRAKFVVGTGGDLSGIPSRSVDFVFSYIVFQHIPDKTVILRYIEETRRVLRPKGLFRFHLNGLPHLSLGGVLLEGYISRSPRLRRIGFSSLPLVRRRRLGSWLGHPVSLGEVRRTCSRSGLKVLSVSGRWTEHMWVGGGLSIEVAAS